MPSSAHWKLTCNKFFSGIKLLINKVLISQILPAFLKYEIKMGSMLRYRAKYQNLS